MSKENFSIQKKSKPFQINKSSSEYYENQKIIRRTTNETFPGRRFPRQSSENFTGNTPSYINSNIVTNQSLSNKDINSKGYEKSYKISNLDSSMGMINKRNTNDQSISSYAKGRNDNMSENFATIKTSDYCTCDEGKDNSLINSHYRRNTTNFISKTISANDHNILIQENSGYCTCDEKGEREKFNNQNSEYYEYMPEVLTDEEIVNNPNSYEFSNIYTSSRENLDLNQENLYNIAKNQTEHYKIEQNKINQSQTDENGYNQSQNKFICSSLNQILTSSYNDFPIQTTDIEEIGNEQTKQNIYKLNKLNSKQEINREKIEESQETQVSWSGENYIQAIERMQFLVSDPPELSVQFLNDMFINRTVNSSPIQILLPFQENYIQKQGILEVLSEEENKKTDINQELCAENVDLLNISKAYSIPFPSFTDLEIENEDIFIQGDLKPENELQEQEGLFLEGKRNNFSIENYNLCCSGSENRPYVIENYGWDIMPSEKTWSGNMKAVRINKLNIERPILNQKPNWNDVIQKELAIKYNVETQEKKISEKKIEKLEKKEKSKEKKLKDKSKSKGVEGLYDRRGRSKPIEELTELEKLKAENRLLKAQAKQQQMEIDFLKKLDAVERR